jgi:hypothetical protein
MPDMGLRESFDLETRNKYTKVDCEVGLKVSGRELPNMAVLGEALEAAIELIQSKVSESYKEVPVRDGATPMAEPSLEARLAAERQAEVARMAATKTVDDEPSTQVTPNVPDFG